MFKGFILSAIFLLSVLGITVLMVVSLNDSIDYEIEKEKQYQNYILENSRG